MIESFSERISGRRARITKESVLNAFNEVSYDGSKITRSIPFEYSGIEEVVNSTCSFIKHQNEKS
jgi:hypothetical protein